MYQKLIVAGYLGRDPEMRYTPDGTPVTNFSIATSNKWTRADGSQVEETTWFRITAWRQLAETCNQYLSKGQPVLVEGRLKPDEFGNPRIWTNNEGEPRTSYEVTAAGVRFLGRRSESTTEEEGPLQDMSEDEIPF